MRGLYGRAFTSADEKIFKIWRTKISEKIFQLQAGEIKIFDEKIFVGTGEGILEILEIQAPNAKKMSTADFLRGHKNFSNYFSTL